MADGENAASLNIQINAADNASGTLAHVKNEIEQFEKTSGKAAVQTEKLNTGLAHSGTASGRTAAQVKAYAATLDSSEGSIKKLNDGLKEQQKITRAEEVWLHDSAKALSNKKMAVTEAAQAYKNNIAPLKENIEAYKAQKVNADELLASNNKEIESLKWSEKYLNLDTAAKKENKKAIAALNEENKILKQRSSGLSETIAKTEQAIDKETNTYRKAQNEVKNAAAAHETLKKRVQASKESEEAYKSSIAAAEAEYNSFSARSLRAAKKWETAGKGIKEFGEGVDTVTKPLQYAAVGTVAAGAAAAKAAMDYETAFTGVKKTVDGTPEQLEAVNNEIRQMAKTTPVSAAGLADIAAAGGQLGVGVDNIAKFTKTIAALNVSTNLKGEEGAKVMAQMMNVTGDSIDNVDRASSAIVALGNNTATTEADIAHMALRMGKFGNTVRMNTPQVLGYSAALASAGIEAQLGGSAIGRTWLDIESAVVNGGSALKTYAKYAGVSAKEFKKQWNTDSSGAFNGLIKGLSSAKNLTAALEELGIENTQDQQAVMALANNYDLLTKCMELSSTAYSENTALMKEANTAYETTANQIQLAKNAVVDAGISWGNVLLPEIRNGAQWVGGLAEKFAGLDDSTKKSVVSAGKAVAATGLISKAAVGGIKSVGGFAEGISKIKEYAPGLVKVAAAAAPVAAGVAGITVAAVAGKAAYDAWYTSQYRWSKGLSEGNAKVKASLDSYKKISDIQGEVKSLKLIIENPDSSAEQVETAKQRLEEIKQLLSEEYNLVINTDNSNLEKAVEQVKEISKNELYTNINKQRAKFAELNRKDANYAEKRAELQEKYNEAQAKSTKFSEMNTELSDIQRQRTEGLINQLEEYTKIKEVFEKYGEGKAFSGKSNDDYAYAERWAKELSEKASGYKDKIDDLDGTHAEMQAVSEELANWETEFIRIAAAEGDFEGVTKALDDMSSFIKSGNLDMNGYAQAAALAMNGIDKLETAWSRAANGDGQALNGIVNDYIRSMQAFGASAQETATGAALIQNGFRTISEAAAAGKLDVVVEQANQITHAMGLLPKSAHIEISANGDISVVDELADKITLLDGRECEITLNADGTPATATIEGVEYAVSNYDGKTHTAVLTAEDGVSFTVNFVTGEISEIPPEHETNITAKDNTSEGVESAKAQLSTVKDKEVTITVHTVTLSSGATVASVASNGKITRPTGFSGFAKKAKGTQNFEGGFAMVNDQKGVYDPRELIVDKGRAFIPQGKDVILPLSKGAKVYTAAQTKAIMSGLGIPRYADGKDNSDAFIKARDDWSHYTKTHAVTNIQELEKQKQLLKEAAQNAKDIADAEEAVYAAQLKVNKELDEASEKYIKNRTFNNDWADYGDDPTAAFDRYRERQNDLAAASEQTWQEAGENIHNFGENLFDGRVEQSLKWLEHERKYNNMSTEDYIAGLQRIQDYTKAYYEQEIIDLEKCRASMTEIDEKYLDSVKEMQEEAKAANDEKYSAWEKSKDNWIKIHNTYDDWDEIGDSLSQVYARSIKQQDEFLKKGVIDWQTAQDNKLEYSLEMYSAVSDEYDEILRKQSDEISKMREKFSADESALRTSWDVSDRAADLDEVNKLLGIYKNAVTDGGQQKYKDLLKQKEQLDRDEQLYQLQVKNNAVLDKMQAEYDMMEENKKNVLDKLKLYGREAADCTVEIERISEDSYSLAKEIGLEYASMSNVTHSYLADMCSLLSGIKKALGGGKNVYNDNRQISIRGSERIADMVVTNADIVYTLSK
ncbi:MAG: phage tail tape measure protein [bacterium]|nr:phage tail tape measure protein [bacterium]